MGIISDVGNAITGGITSAAGGLAGSVLDTFTQDQLADNASARAYEANKNLYQHRYRWAVEDLKKAGLNPILAAGGLSGSPSGVGTITPTRPDTPASALKLRQERKMEADENLVNAQEGLAVSSKKLNALVGALRSQEYNTEQFRTLQNQSYAEIEALKAKMYRKYPELLMYESLSKGGATGAAVYGISKLFSGGGKMLFSPQQKQRFKQNLGKRFNRR